MCESMVGCEGVVFVIWWWILVLEVSRSSRLSVVGYTSRPAHTTEDVQKYADTLDPGQFFSFWLLQTVLYPITYCYVLSSWIWMLFWPPRRSSPPDERFAFSWFHASSEDDNRSPFGLSLVHATFLTMRAALNDNENSNETISIFLQIVLCWWVAKMWKYSWEKSVFSDDVTGLASVDYVHINGFNASERPGVCCCKSSAGLLSTNWVQHLLLSLKTDGVTVVCSCIGRYHTIPYHTVGALRKKAPSTQGCCGTSWNWIVKRLPESILPLIDMAHSGYTVKRLRERPKTKTLTNSHTFQLRFCRSLRYGYVFIQLLCVQNIQMDIPSILQW